MKHLGTSASEHLIPQFLSAEIALIEAANPDYRLAGSLGRAVFYDQQFGNPYYEFSLRNEHPLYKGLKLPRDIDVLNAPDTQHITGPYAIDTAWANNPEAAVIQVGGDWRLQSSRRGFDEPIDADVMTPIRGETVYGISAQTVPARTHLALFAVRGTLRRKDDLPMQLVKQLADSSPLQPPLSKYEPFVALANMQDRGLVTHLSKVYRRHAPEFVKRVTGDIVSNLRNKHS